VDSKILNRNTWYIDIDVFGSTTVTDYEKTVSTLKESVPSPKAIILDLRSNGGGYINMAAQIIGNFLPEFTTLVTLDYGEYSQDIVNSVDGKYQDIPLYILVNGNTASASEILTQDLKEMAGATVIGTQTYGKGSAQTLTEFWDGSELKLTIAHWLSGKGTSIHGVGVTPDVTIPSDQASVEDHG
jgi:carboxyl-terminal processing protease